MTDDALRALADEIERDRQSATDRAVAILSEIRDVAALQRQQEERLAALSESVADTVARRVSEVLTGFETALREQLARLEDRVHATVDDRLQVLLDDRIGRLEDTLREAATTGGSAVEGGELAAELREVMEAQLTLMRATLRDELDHRAEQEERLLGSGLAALGSRLGETIGELRRDLIAGLDDVALARDEDPA